MAGTDMAVVRMRGLPFRTSEFEIAEFFRGFDLVQNSIQLRQDDSGRATGEGTVAFTSRIEAERAIRERNKHHIGSRYVELFF